ncbi:FAD:protein FMN transferase [Thermodesulfobacteriota bacterium]
MRLNRALFNWLMGISLVCLLSSCVGDDKAQLYRTTRLMMGTFVEITVAGNGPKVKEAAQAVIAELARVEKLTSFHQSSALGAINDKAGVAPVSPGEELLKLVNTSLDTARKTSGAFDPTVGPLSRLWNFSGGDPTLPDRQDVQRATAKVGWKRVALDAETGTIFLPHEGMSLDLGAIAKGYALDRAKEVLTKYGVSSALINAGGDVLGMGLKQPGKPWRVGIQDPRNPRDIVAVVDLTDRVIVTSGDYERFFTKDGKRYHHILDPRTGYPARGVQSVTIVAPDGVTADALATAVFVLGPGQGLEIIESTPGVEGFFIDSSGEVRVSSGGTEIFETRGR